jgi:hypothetical protein
MSENRITNKQLRAIARSYGVSLRQTRGKWCVKDQPGSTGLWEWAGETNEQAAQFLADQFTADHSIENLLARAANCD